MSYIISITRNVVPTNEEAAWEYLSLLQEKEAGPPAQDFIDLLKVLLETYPCNSVAGPDDDTYWLDEPLLESAGQNVTLLGIRSHWVTEVMPFAVRTATRLGFVVFDEQVGLIYRPSGYNTRTMN